MLSSQLCFVNPLPCALYARQNHHVSLNRYHIGDSMHAALGSPRLSLDDAMRNSVPPSFQNKMLPRTRVIAFYQPDGRIHPWNLKNPALGAADSLDI